MTADLFASVRDGILDSIDADKRLLHRDAIVAKTLACA